MNKKTFAWAVSFLLLTLVWLGYSLFELVGCFCAVHVWNLLVALAAVAAAGCIVYNEFGKKRRIHLEDVNPHKIP